MQANSFLPLHTPVVLMFLQNRSATSLSQILPLAKSGQKVLLEIQTQRSKYRSLAGTCLAAVQVKSGEVRSHFHLPFC